jgi:hypothetical protein
MNKKVLTVMLAIVLMAGYAQAQLAFGVRAGLNLTNLDGDFTDNNKMKPGFQLGAVADYALSKAVSIQPGILFATQGCKFQITETVEGEQMKIKSTTNLNYLQIPVNAQFKIDMGGVKLLLQAGPYLGFALSGKNRTESTVAGITEKEDNDVKIGSGEGETKRFDLGLGAGAGLQFGNIQASAGYNFGLTNINNKSEFIENNRLWNTGLAVTVTYLFGK